MTMRRTEAVMDGWQLLSSPALPGLIEGLRDHEWPELDDHPLFGRFVRRLYPAIRAPGRSDRSFAVARGDVLLLVMPCTLDDGLLSCFGIPASCMLRVGLTPDERSAAVALAFRHLAQMGSAGDVREALIRGSGDSVSFPEVDAECRARDARAESLRHAVIDLALPREGIWRGTRDSFRSLINWGRRNVRLEYVNGDTFDRDACHAYAEFHAQVAGRVVHGPAYWKVVSDEIRAGRAEMTLGRFEDGRLIAGNIVTFAGRIAYYASGVYDRSLFPKPIGHWPVYDAVLRAKDRGLARFDLGEIPPPGGIYSEKGVNIGRFKRGFTDTFEIMNRWRWSFRA